MKISAWRITKRKHAKTAFTGEGARLYGGRWNSSGTAVVYTAQTQSLAVLEVLVHLDSPELLKEYFLFELQLDDSRISELGLTALPRNWKRDPAPAAVQALGDEWVAKAASVALRVPSTLVPGESNFLFNPRHADFSELHIGAPVRFQFDPRLARGQRNQ